MPDHRRPESVTIYTIAQTIRQLAHELPFYFLTPDEVKRTGGRLIARAAEVVSDVATELTERPGLYPEADVSGPDLMEEQKTADAWLFLGVVLGTLSRICMNNHVRAQALAFTRCKRLINSVVAGWQHPELAPHLDHDRRLDGLRSAIRAIAESTQGRGRRAAARPAQQPGAVPRTPAQERAIKEQIRGRKRDRRAQLLRVFEDLLRSRRPPA